MTQDDAQHIVNAHVATMHGTVEWSKRAIAAEAEVERLRAEVAELRRALILARQYVAKAEADGAYVGAVMSGARALARIDTALEGAEA